MARGGMARIEEFIIGTNLYNFDGLTHDLLGKILEEHIGGENAVTHAELCHYYYDPYPIQIEEELIISNVLQRARGILQTGGWFLDFRRGRGWFAVQTVEEAFDHVQRYAKREIRLHQRLQGKAHIAVGTRYQLPANNPLILAIQGMTPVIEQLEEAVESSEPPQLEEGDSNEN